MQVHVIDNSDNEIWNSQSSLSGLIYYNHPMLINITHNSLSTQLTHMSLNKITCLSCNACVL